MISNKKTCNKISAMNKNTMQDCSKCHKTLSKSMFSPKGDGLYKQCITCRDRYGPKRTNMGSCDRRPITLTERVDSVKLNYLINNHDKYNLGKSYVDGKLIDGQAQLTLLIGYYKSLNQNSEVKISYRQRGGCGRYFNKPHDQRRIAIQNISRPIRHTICKDTMYDLDMKNAHPTLLSWYCHQNDIDCAGLDHYISNRDECLEEMMILTDLPKDVIKADLLAIINGRLKYVDDNHHDRPDWYIEYYLNLRDIMDAVCKLNPNLYKRALAKKKGFGNDKVYNVAGTCINYLMCSLENKALMAAYDALTAKGIEVSALVYDGLMVYKKCVSGDNLNNLLRSLEEAVDGVMPGCNIKWALKEMDEGFVIPNKELADYTPVEFENVYTSPVDTLFDKSETPFVSVEHVPPDIKYVQDLDWKGRRCLAIQSSLGSGKTTSITRWIDDNKPKRVLVLSPRQSFARSICNEYNEKIKSKGFKCYLDFQDKDTLRSVDRLVISMESLHNLSYFDGVKAFDLLVVDECQANLVSHVCQTTNGAYFETNSDMFTELLHDSQRVIFADAFMGSKTLNFLTDMELPTTLYIYHAPMVKREAIIVEGQNCKDLDCIIPCLEESLAKGERNYVVVSSQKRLGAWVLYLKDRFPNKNFISYVSGEGKCIHDVKKEWSEMDCVLTTCTITVGINFDTPGMFHNVFIDVSARAKNLVSDIFQSHYRVRHLINNQVYIHIADYPIDKLSCDWDEISNDLEWLESSYISKSSLYKKAPYAIKRLVNNNIFEFNLSYCRLTEMVVYYLNMCNYTITKKKNSEDVELESTVDQVHQPFNTVTLLGEDSYNMLKLKQIKGIKLSDSEKNQLEKYSLVCSMTDNRPHVWVDNRDKDEDFWKTWLEYKRTKIQNIKTEKGLRTGRLKMDELHRRASQKNSYAIMQQPTNLRVQNMLDICKDLGIDVSQRVGTVIPMEMISKWCDGIRVKHLDIRKVFELRDRRKNKSTMTNDDCIDLLNSVFKKFGFTKITRLEQRRIVVNGKRVRDPNTPYVLEAYCDVKSLNDDNDKSKNDLGMSIYDRVSFGDPSLRQQANPFVIDATCDDEHTGSPLLGWI